MATYAETVMFDAPTSYWRLGEPSGTTAADQVGAAPGVYVGAPTQNVPGPIGCGGSGVTLNGTNQYITIADAASLHLVDGPMTLELWFKRNGLGTNQGLISRGANGWYVRFNAANQLEFLKSQVGSILVADDAITDTLWHYLAVMKNGSLTYLWLDGNQPGWGGGAGQTLTDGGGTAYIGADQGGSEPFSGSIDEVAIYNTILSPGGVAARITEHYQSGLRPPGDPTEVATVTFKSAGAWTSGWGR